MCVSYISVQQTVTNADGRDHLGIFSLSHEEDMDQLLAKESEYQLQFRFLCWESIVLLNFGGVFGIYLPTNPCTTAVLESVSEVR